MALPDNAGFVTTTSYVAIRPIASNQNFTARFAQSVLRDESIAVFNDAGERGGHGIADILVRMRQSRLQVRHRELGS